MKALNVVLDPLDELSLVLPDGAADMWPHEQGIEPREDAEHFIGILGCAQLIPEARCDASLWGGMDGVV